MSEEKERTQIGMKKNEPPTHKLHFRKPLKSGMHLERKKLKYIPETTDHKASTHGRAPQICGGGCLFWGCGGVPKQVAYIFGPRPLF